MDTTRIPPIAPKTPRRERGRLSGKEKVKGDAMEHNPHTQMQKSLRVLSRAVFA